MVFVAGPVAIVVPCLLVLFTTLADEAVERSGHEARPRQVSLKCAANIHLAFVMIFFSISRGGIFPASSERARDLAAIFVFMSLVFGLMAHVIIRRDSNRIAFLIAIISILIIFGFALWLSHNQNQTPKAARLITTKSSESCARPTKMLYSR